MKFYKPHPFLEISGGKRERERERDNSKISMEYDWVDLGEHAVKFW